MALARPGVQRERDGVATVLSEIAHAHSLGQVLPDEPIGVFVGPSLPRMVRRREVDRHSRGSLNCLVVVKLGAVVSCDALEELDRKSVV